MFIKIIYGKRSLKNASCSKLLTFHAPRIIYLFSV